MSQTWEPTTPKPEPQNPALTSLSDLSAAYPGVRQFGIPAEQASDACFLHDFQGRITDVNRQACEMLGYTREELLGMTIFDISIDHNLRSAQAVWRDVQPGKSILITSHERRKDGSAFPVEARISGYRIKGRPFFLSQIRDVSEHQRVEQSAFASEDRYRLLFNSIDEGFCVIETVYDADGKPIDYLFLEVNPAFQKHVGIVGAEGRTVREVAPNIETKWIEIYHNVAVTGQPIRFVEQSPALGRFFDIYAFRVGTPEHPRVATLFTNITDRIAAEKALLKSEKLALVGLLSGVISHEIRNPIDSIDNLLYLAAQETDLATLHDYVRIAKGELDRVSNIITHTLHFNRQSETPAPERLSAILESAVAVYDFRIRQSGVKLRRVYEEKDTVSCLASELRQVFINFIINAFEASPEGGTVTLKTRASPGWKTGAPGVRATIADTGHGMNKKTRKHLFDAFYTTKGTQGTGLGLWVSREILHRHAAHVCVRSRQTPGSSGTVFHLWFPLTFPNSPPPPRP